MFKVRWEENNLVVLDDNTENEIIPPRPVFYEELDLLGFDKYWNYPKSNEPILWAIGRDYYYNGEKIGKTVGGNLYEAPKLELYKSRIDLKPINIKKLIEINRKNIETLKNEAIEFIKKVYNDYKNRVDFFIVAFSGGKDSQVLLDLITIALEPDKYKVIFTDTTMELPHTYKTVKETQKHYQNIYKNFKITTVKNPIDAEKLWGVFGPPSRIIRWCCSVYKSSPIQNYLKSLKQGKQPKIVLFDGVRGDESNRRSSYDRIAHAVKNINSTNVRPLLKWNDFEIYLYIFYAKINLNHEYKIGLHRVGCSICPFASQWSDFIIKKKYPNIADKFISIINNYITNNNIKNTKLYLQNGDWKKRAGGNAINTSNFIDFNERRGELFINLKNSNENIFEWLKVLGNYKVNSSNNNIHIKLSNRILNIDFYENKNYQILSIKKDNILDISHLKKVAYKTSYCVHCGSCEAECPTGALTVFPKVKVDTNLCIHCSKCLDFTDKGCIMAKSVNTTEKINKLTDYSSFGMRSAWLLEFLKNKDKWFVSNTLGSRQIDSMKRWLRDSELLEPKSTQTTKLFNLLREKELQLIYEILFINLYYKSNLIKWYIDNIPFQKSYSINDLVSLGIEYTNKSDKTIRLIMSALLNLFDTTPLGKDLKIGYITKERNIRYIQKIGTNDVSNEAILYSLYKLKENLKRDNFRVKEFYEDGFEGGPYKIFGIEKEALIQKLKFISEDTKLIDVNLIQGLDNVFLKDFSAIEVLEEILK